MPGEYPQGEKGTGSYQRHRPVLVTIDGEPAEVDEKILPVVVWLNAIPGVSTLYSCEGCVEEGGLPYVMLHADTGAMRPLLDRLREVWVIEPADSTRHLLIDKYRVDVRINYLYERPRYTLYWANEEHLALFTAEIRSRGWNCGKSSCQPLATTGGQSAPASTACGTRESAPSRAA